MTHFFEIGMPLVNLFFHFPMGSVHIMDMVE